jgi:dimethylglycine dehydrogenase
VIKAKEDYCLRHEIPFPHFNRLAGRPVKPSPLYERLKAKGAVFEEVYGHRAPALVRQDRGRGAARPLLLPPPVVDTWSPSSRRRCASAAGIMDISAFTKVEVAGPDAYALSRPADPNRLPQKTGALR